MKFRAHETFAIRKGWLHKGLRYVMNNPRVFIDKNINQMDTLGIGANMVKALRYWLQATGLTTEGTGNNRNQTVTPFGQLVWNHDSYFEEDGTWYLIHYMLSSNEELATAWYYLFNEYEAYDITKENFQESLNHFAVTKGNKSISQRVLKDEFECVIKTYFASGEDTNPENNTTCPLSELNLIGISENNRKGFIKLMPKASSIDAHVILAVIVNEYNKKNEKTEIKISALEKDPCNIGKTFNLDNLSILSYLDKLQSMGYLKVIRTAGLDIVQLNHSMTFEQCVDEYYRSINE